VQTDKNNGGIYMILDDIVKAKRLQIELEKITKPLENYLTDLDYQALPTRNFKRALKHDGISIIAEIKKSSPSKGIIVENFNPVDIGKIYEKINIDAVSILTEKQFFNGDDSYIKLVKKINNKPILRKDFIIDKYQVYQSKAIGADAILLITAILGDKVKEYYDLACSLGLDCLTEVHSQAELEIALSARCDIIGINNRNLNDFTVNLSTTQKLLNNIPDNITVVSESGIKKAEDIQYLSSLGVDAVLVGETFMRNINDKSYIKKFIDTAKSINANFISHNIKEISNYD
jgi:indole-3-glycerol phosphate synthase